MHKAYSRLVSLPQCESLADTCAVILAGGLGQRLLPFTAFTPKPLLPVLNLSLLLWTAARLRQVGITFLAANVCHLADAFQKAQTVCEEYGTRLHLVREAKPTGPLGGLISCLPILPQVDICIVLSGDALYSVNYGGLVASHRASGSDLTLTTKAMYHPSRYGVIEIDRHGYVTRMREKPLDVRSWEYVSCGLYVMSTRLLATLAQPPAGTYDFVHLVESMLASGEPVHTYPLEDWHDVSTPRDLLRVNLLQLRSRYIEPIATCSQVTESGELWTDDDDYRIGQGAVVLGRALLGTGSRIDNNSILRNVVIGAGATVQEGATVTHSIILDGATVTAGSRVQRQIVRAE